jgi:hypothetical protein
LGAQPLFAQHQPALRTGAHHARGVGVAPAAGIPFRGDQHVLAERGQMMAADRAAVRRRLAIRRTAHRPPGGWRKTPGHRPIVPPTGLTAIATVLAVAGLGVGIALARVQLERRSERPRPAPRRARPRPALLRDEPIAEGLRQVILGQLDLAIALLEDDPAATARAAAGESTVHETRKALKRLRALLALLRGELSRDGEPDGWESRGPESDAGESRYVRERNALRECARRLAGARDAEVMVDTLEALWQRHPALGRRQAVLALHAQLVAERDAAASGIEDPQLRAAVAGELRAVRARVDAWELRERGFELVAPGLERVYRQGRRGLRVARRRRDVEALHTWRKRVKDLRYAAETLDRASPAESSRDRGRDAAHVRRIARRADRLGEMLGEEHDLALLAQGVRARSERFADEGRTRKRLLKAIARRRKQLRKRALRDGERLYRRGPRRFVRRMRTR